MTVMTMMAEVAKEFNVSNLRGEKQNIGYRSNNFIRCDSDLEFLII